MENRSIPRFNDMQVILLNKERWLPSSFDPILKFSECSITHCIVRAPTSFLAGLLQPFHNNVRRIRRPRLSVRPSA